MPSYPLGHRQDHSSFNGVAWRSVCCEVAGEGSSESFDGTVYKGIYDEGLVQYVIENICYVLCWTPLCSSNWSCFQKGLCYVFAAIKFQQPIKDDIGDKSVFTFNALPEADKDA
ncbi:hypothetical protein IEQ34_001718 [Dendrobium chrysotoxum]|uniref:Uncharacterized protein n=1 Tax=Dendrobium chrysotoxum TaxID=161865 RepID=A0AAV7H7L9_DENCH|nr:hypothetical protein IEQ34_001718 [Dendrobium chrysotoxum]